MKRITIQDLSSYKSKGERFAMLTAYDYMTATNFDKTGIFIQGHDTPLPVTVDAMVYHCEIAARAVHHALVIGDLPFGSCCFSM